MFYPLTEALVFVTIIHWFNAIWRLLYFRKGFDSKLVWSFGLSGVITAILGAKLVFSSDEHLIIKSMAIFLFCYSGFLLVQPNFKLKFSWLTANIGGVLSGFTAGIFGMGGAIRSAILAAFDLPKEIYLANSALLLVCIDSSRLITYLSEGIEVSHLLNLGFIKLIIAILVSFIGVSIGKNIVDKIPQKYFRLIVALFLFAVSIRLLFI